VRVGRKPVNPCQHQHLNGAWCKRSARVDRGYCSFHKQDTCRECEDMLKVFPIRKSTMVVD